MTKHQQSEPNAQPASDGGSSEWPTMNDIRIHEAVKKWSEPADSTPAQPPASEPSGRELPDSPINGGLYRRYKVEKVQGESDPRAFYFVLRLDQYGDDQNWIDCCRESAGQLVAALNARSYLPNVASDLAAYLDSTQAPDSPGWHPAAPAGEREELERLREENRRRQETIEALADRLYASREIWSDECNKEILKRAQGEADVHGVPVSVVVHGATAAKVLPKELSRLRHERQQLANGIASAAKAFGIIDGTVPLTGPQLLQLCDDLGNIANGYEQYRADAAALEASHAALLSELQAYRDFDKEIDNITAEPMSDGQAAAIADNVVAVSKIGELEAEVATVLRSREDVVMQLAALQAKLDAVAGLVEKWRATSEASERRACIGHFPEGYSAESRAYENCADELADALAE
jgi:hypothetical protein